MPFVGCFYKTVCYSWQVSKPCEDKDVGKWKVYRCAEWDFGTVEIREEIDKELLIEEHIGIDIVFNCQVNECKNLT